MPRIWQLNVVAFENSTLLNGSILDEEESNTNLKAGILKQSLYLIASYFKKTARFKKLVVKTPNDSYPIRLSKRGFFNYYIPEKLDENPEFFINQEKLVIQEEYPSFFPCSLSKTDIISDLDDTVFLSHTGSIIRRTLTILFRNPKNRKPIDYTLQLFEHFKEFNPRIIYLSRSESNLFGLISAIFRFHDLPEGVLLLTPFHKLKDLFTGAKAANHKQLFLQGIFKASPNKKFILLGDDSQHDMSVYLNIAKEYPSQIEKIFIRQTRKKKSPKHLVIWNKIKEQKIPCKYFNDSDNFNPEL